MYEALVSILTEQRWTFNEDSVRPVEICFNKNGTGEVSEHWRNNPFWTIWANTGKLYCIIEFQIFIAAEFDWKALGPSLEERKVKTNNASPDTPIELAQVEIELTLSTRPASRLEPQAISNLCMNQDWLTDDAFKAKKFTITLEQGRFTSPNEIHSYESKPRYELRLVFSPSVFPPESEWKEPRNAAAAYRFWEWNEFCSRELSPTWMERVGNMCSLM